MNENDWTSAPPVRSVLLAGVAALTFLLATLPVAQADQDLTTATVGAFASHDGVVSVSNGGSPIQTVCARAGAILKSPWIASDGRPMPIGQLRNSLFTMTATEAGDPAGSSTQTVTWTRTPYNGASGPGTTPALVISPTSDPIRILLLELDATYYEGAALHAPLSAAHISKYIVLTCSASLCSEELLSDHGSPDELIAEYYACETGTPPPLLPTVRAEPLIGPTIIGTPHVCTGTHQTVSTGTASGSVSGGLIIEAKVEYSISLAVLEQYDFACDYAMIAQAHGEQGFVRRVRMELDVDGAAQGVPFGASCSYTGIPPDDECTTFAPVLEDAFSGAGIAGPAGGGTSAWPLPTQVKICPPSEPYVSMTAIGETWQGIPLYELTDGRSWTCQSFAIHYQ